MFPTFTASILQVFGANFNLTKLHQLRNYSWNLELYDQILPKRRWQNDPLYFVRQFLVFAVSQWTGHRKSRLILPVFRGGVRGPMSDGVTGETWTRICSVPKRFDASESAGRPITPEKTRKEADNNYSCIQLLQKKCRLLKPVAASFWNCHSLSRTVWLMVA